LNPQNQARKQLKATSVVTCSCGLPRWDPDT
jgi:hypothetical protein